VTTALESVLRAYVDRDLEQLALLQGMPESPSFPDVAAALGADPTVFVRWFLGDPPTETFWCPAMVDGFSRVKIWFRGDIVVKVEGEYPVLRPDATDVLGTPDLQLDYRLDVVLTPGGDRVWPSRGLAVKFNAAGTLVVAMTVFPPTTAAGYRERLRDDPGYRETPAPGAEESAR
jgi:hypothetical protein